ncbi:MAG: phosphoribosyltransferase [Gemmatimonadota bacterium]|nr:phosphoribosyltransferase [Gemmatimonadota bacterium]MDE3215935.1 phosphoribosyltransferase [Gemmatimonadota bacterium]
MSWPSRSDPAQPSVRFTDRREAGRRLAALLREYEHDERVIVLGLPRGGVPVAFEVAEALDAPLDAFVVRKLGVPGHEEYAMGAIASGGIRVLNHDAIRELHLPLETVDAVERAERVELERRERLYRGARGPIALRGRIVLLVDDGLATGSTMLAAVAAVRTQEPARIVVAAPVASRDACEALGRRADACVSVAQPDPFYGVGLWYLDFTQTTDDEVRRLLAARAAREPAAADH